MMEEKKKGGSRFGSRNDLFVFSSNGRYVVMCNARSFHLPYKEKKSATMHVNELRVVEFSCQLIVLTCCRQ